MGNITRNALPLFEEVSVPHLMCIKWDFASFFIITICSLGCLESRWPGCRTLSSSVQLVSWTSKGTCLAVSTRCCVQEEATPIPPICTQVCVHLDTKPTQRGSHWATTLVSISAVPVTAANYYFFYLCELAFNFLNAKWWKQQANASCQTRKTFAK